MKKLYFFFAESNPFPQRNKGGDRIKFAAITRQLAEKIFLHSLVSGHATPGYNHIHVTSVTYACQTSCILVPQMLYYTYIQYRSGIYPRHKFYTKVTDIFDGLLVMLYILSRCHKVSHTLKLRCLLSRVRR